MSQRFFQYLLVLMLSGSAYADSGFYVGGTAGYSWPSTEVNDFTRLARADASGFTLKEDTDFGGMSKGLFAGYWIKDYLAIETAYTKAHSSIAYRFTATNAIGLSADIDRLSVSLTPSYALSELFDLYGRLGYVHSSVQYEQKGGATVIGITDPTQYVLEDDSGDGVLIGFGVRFHGEHHYMRVEAHRDYTLDGLTGITMGFGYQF